jgi:hypothetical protein
MTDQASNNVRQFFTEYVRLRQSGRPVEEAARDLQSAAERLNRHELNELASLTQNWEASYRARPRQASAARQAMTAGMREAAPTAASPVAAYAAEMVPCPQCGKRNQAEDVYCYSCGEILFTTRTSSDTRRLEDTIGTRKKLGEAYFGLRSKLVLHIVNGGENIEITPTEADMVLGRATPGTALNPDIDLTPYGADALGVSRLHVSLKRNERTLTITDMNSSNKTYINSQLLHPHEVRVLNDGDEIRLGRMFIQVRFVHLT